MSLLYPVIIFFGKEQRNVSEQRRLTRKMTEGELHNRMLDVPMVTLPSREPSRQQSIEGH